MQTALKTCTARICAPHLKKRRHRIRKFCRVAEAQGMGTREARSNTWTIGPSARLGRMLRSRRPLSPALNPADDGDSGASRRSEGDSRSFSTSSASDAGRGGALGSARVLSRWRRAGDRSAGVRHKNNCASRQDRRTRKSLRHHRKENRRFRLRHRFSGWPDRGAHFLRRWRAVVSLHPTWLHKPSTIRMRWCCWSRNHESWHTRFRALWISWRAETLSRSRRCESMEPVLLAGSRGQAIDWTNLIAPEHLTTSAQESSRTL